MQKKENNKEQNSIRQEIKTTTKRKSVNPKVGSWKIKINKTHKFLGILFKSQREKKQITNVRRERMAITTDSINTKIKTRRY